MKLMLKITMDWGKGLVDSLTVYPVDSVKGANRIPVGVTRKNKEAAVFLLTKEQAEELAAELTVRLGELK